MTTKHTKVKKYKVRTTHPEFLAELKKCFYLSNDEMDTLHWFFVNYASYLTLEERNELDPKIMVEIPVFFERFYLNCHHKGAQFERSRYLALGDLLDRLKS